MAEDLQKTTPSETRLYAMKCKEGYLRISAGGFEVVGLPKASVFNSPDDLHAAAGGLGGQGTRGVIGEQPLPPGTQVVELTITERVFRDC
jgi:hypothetical protein